MGRATARSRGVVVVDAGVVIALVEHADPHGDAAERALIDHAEADLRIPASAYAEVLMGPARQGQLAQAKADVSLLGLAVEPVSEAIAEATAELRARNPSVRLPDALVLGTAQAIEADVVLTTDRRLRGVDPRVKIVA